MDMDAPKAAATIHPRPLSSAPAPPAAAAAAHPGLPPLLHTPGGLALLELQGEFNLPPPPLDALRAQADGDGDDDDEAGGALPAPPPAALAIGRIEFPDYDPTAGGPAAASTAWMGRVHLYVGPHQRLTGEAKKLPRPLAVVRRRQRARPAGQEAAAADDAADDDNDADQGTDLEMVDVVHYKLLFSQRPEPMTESHTLE